MSDSQSHDSQSFYSDLLSFSEFERFSENEVYRKVPTDWHVIIADIEGSTKAVKNGRYRDVNTLGAASISVVQSVFKNEPFPFVFGGDGATFLIPPRHLESVKDQLLRLTAFAQSQFQMNLRIGVVSVQEIHEKGLRLEVAKFDLGGGKTSAFIRGGGLTWAEYQIKTMPRKYTLKASELEGLESLSGLSCRWQPLPSRHGQVLAILVKPRLNDSSETFRKILSKFKEILSDNMEKANPVHPQNMSYKGPWDILRSEWKFQKNKFSYSFFSRLAEIAFCLLVFKLKIRGPASVTHYQAQIPTHSDYRKYDDMLRLVLDCNFEQSGKITNVLEQLYREGEIFYGVSESSAALMTCLVETIQDGGHIHFIDGSEGGYTTAAQRMNSQIQAVRASA